MAGDQNLSSVGGGPRSPDLRAALRRQFWVIVAAALVVGGGAFGYASSRKPKYESRSTVLLIATATEDAPGGGLGRTLDVETQATVARSTSLLTAIGERMGLTASQVRKSSHAQAAPTGDILYLYYTAGTAERAAEGATTYTEEFLAERKAVVDDAVDAERTLLNTQVKDLSDEISDLTAEIDDLVAQGDNASTTQLTVLQQSQALAIRDLSTAKDNLAKIENTDSSGRVVVDPRTAVSKTGLQVPFTTLGGALVGLLMGFVIALLRDRNDDRYGSAVGLDQMGIRESGRIRYVSNPKSPGRIDPGALRAYARLLTRLSFANGLPSDTERSVLLVGVESVTLPGEAADRVAEMLAIESSKLGIVLEVFSVESSAPAGQSYWEKVPTVIGDLARVNDLVLVPGQPLDRTATGLGLASVVTETLLLVSLKTPVSVVQQAIDDLRSVEAEDVSVVVLTNVPRRSGR
jgi:ElaB/YqjD/DUF883 family membrane-anchored ribosome-binding protein